MPDASKARDAARAADDRRHDLTVILEDVLIILDGEVAKPDSPESAAWLARAGSRIAEALAACDALRAAISATQADVAKLRPDPAVKLLEEALHLRQNGERAPGGRENWHDWDDKAERFLRGLLPPEREDDEHA